MDLSILIVKYTNSILYFSKTVEDLLSRRRILGTIKCLHTVFDNIWGFIQSLRGGGHLRHNEVVQSAFLLYNYNYLLSGGEAHFQMIQSFRSCVIKWNINALEKIFTCIIG